MFRSLVAVSILMLSLGCETKRTENQSENQDQQQMLAEVFGESIYRRDLEPTEGELKNYRTGYPGLGDAELRTKVQTVKLTERIVSPLLERFEKSLDTSATEQEVKDYLASMPGMEKNPDMIPFAKGYVQQWKLDKALYEKYGGVVIFQQANPLEPVGAYRALFEENEKAGNFTIYDDLLRNEFWSYYVREHPFQVPAAEVDFSVPWWKKVNE